MTRLMTLALLAFAASLTAYADGIVKKPSHFGVSETLDRLETIVTQKGFKVFARIDHAAGAASIGESLPDSAVLIFGNPKVGTALMSSAIGVALDLPIRVAAFEDSAGQVWVTYHAPASLAKRHDIRGREAVIEKMTGALRALTDAATRAQ